MATTPMASTDSSTAIPGSGSATRAGPVTVTGASTRPMTAANAAPTVTLTATRSRAVSASWRRLKPSAHSARRSAASADSWRAYAWPSTTNPVTPTRRAKAPNAWACGADRPLHGRRALRRIDQRHRVLGHAVAGEELGEVSPERRRVRRAPPEADGDERELLALRQVGLHLRGREVDPRRVVERGRGDDFVGEEGDAGDGEDLLAALGHGDLLLFPGVGVPTVEPVEREGVTGLEVEGLGHGLVDGDLRLLAGVGGTPVDDRRPVDRGPHPFVDAAQGEELQALGGEQLLGRDGPDGRDLREPLDRGHHLREGGIVDARRAQVDVLGQRAVEVPGVRRGGPAGAGRGRQHDAPDQSDEHGQGEQAPPLAAQVAPELRQDWTHRRMRPSCPRSPVGRAHPFDRACRHPWPVSWATRLRIRPRPGTVSAYRRRRGAGRSDHADRPRARPGGGRRGDPLGRRHRRPRPDRR